MKSGFEPRVYPTREGKELVSALGELRAELARAWAACVLAGKARLLPYWIPLDDLVPAMGVLEERGLSFMPLEQVPYPGYRAEGKGWLFGFIRREPVFEPLEEAWRKGDDRAVGFHLGLPFVFPPFFLLAWEPGTYRVRPEANVALLPLGLCPLPALPCEPGALDELGAAVLDRVPSRETLLEFLRGSALVSLNKGILLIEHPFFDFVAPGPKGIKARWEIIPEDSR